MRSVALALGVLLAMVSPAAGALYRWVDAADVTPYTSDRSTIPEQYLRLLGVTMIVRAGQLKEMAA